jgi:hypothetical protein
MRTTALLMRIARAIAIQIPGSEIMAFESKQQWNVESLECTLRDPDRYPVRPTIGLAGFGSIIFHKSLSESQRADFICNAMHNQECPSELSGERLKFRRHGLKILVQLAKTKD